MIKNATLLTTYLIACFNFAFADLEINLTSQPPISYAPPEPVYQPTYKSAALSAGLSILFPGLGHAYLGDMKTAASLAGGTGLAYGAYELAEDPSVYVPSGILSNNTWMYSVYAAYRDARISNGVSLYRYKMPTDSLLDLASAPFRPSILKKPEVWGGLLGKLAVGIGVGYLRYRMTNHAHPPSDSTQHRITPYMALPIGIGEEALFRGYLQPQLSEAINPTAGIILSSLAFGAAHIVNTRGMDKQESQSYCTYIIPFLSCSGLYYGWMAKKNGSLKECVAVHTLYDFTLLCLSAAAGKESIFEDQVFSLSIPF